MAKSLPRGSVSLVVDFDDKAGDVQLDLVLTWNVVVRALHPVGGSRLVLKGHQDSVGSRGLIINGVTVAVPPEPGAKFTLTAWWADAPRTFSICLESWERPRAHATRGGS